VAHAFGQVGGENLSGGKAAKVMPRNLLTVAAADGSEVVVPMAIPEASVASGRRLEADTTFEERKSTIKAVKHEGFIIARIKAESSINLK
jgi:hypothetical protein